MHRVGFSLHDVTICYFRNLWNFGIGERYVGKRYCYVLTGPLLCAASGTVILNICNYFKFYFHRPYNVNTSIGLETLRSQFPKRNAFLYLSYMSYIASVSLMI